MPEMTPSCSSFRRYGDSSVSRWRCDCPKAFPVDCGSALAETMLALLDDNPFANPFADDGDSDPFASVIRDHGSQSPTIAGYSSGFESSSRRASIVSANADPQSTGNAFGQSHLGRE
jgi:hypothetical protein